MILNAKIYCSQNVQIKTILARPSVLCKPFPKGKKKTYFDLENCFKFQFNELHV